MTDAPAPAPAPSAVEAQKAEARGRRQEDGSVVVPLVTDAGTVEITVPHPSMWFEGAVDALVKGRVGEWMRLALEGDALLAWNSAPRKRYRDLENFLAAWTNATGESPGESEGSSES